MVSLSDVFKNIKHGALSRKLIDDEKQAEKFAIQEMNANPESLSFGEKVSNALFGKRPVGIDTVGTPQKDENGNIIIDSAITQSPRVGGFFQDFTKGYQDNRFNPINVNNFGQKKGMAERLGEGFGTIARFGESAPGRGLITAGLIGAFGGSPLEALAYGGTAGMLNQTNRTADKIYRDDLIQSQQNALKNSPEFAALSPEEQQAQLQGIADNIYSQRGYMNKDIYSNLINTQQMRDNADWRKMYFDTQQKNLEENRRWQREEAAMRRADAAANRAVQIRGQDLSYELGREKANKSNIDPKKLNGVIMQLNNFDNIFENVNNPYRHRMFKGYSKKFNTFKPEESNFMTQANLLFNVIARDLGGERGVLSDQDIQRIKEGMPTLDDTLAQKRAKLAGIYSLLEIRLNQHGIPFTNPYDIYGNKKDNDGLNVDMNALEAELARRGVK